MHKYLFYLTDTCVLPVSCFGCHILRLYVYQARSHGGGEGGLSPPGKNWAPLGCPPWHFIGVGIEVYSPPGILSAPPTNDTWLRRWCVQILRLRPLGITQPCMGVPHIWKFCPSTLSYLIYLVLLKNALSCYTLPPKWLAPHHFYLSPLFFLVIMFFGMSTWTVYSAPPHFTHGTRKCDFYRLTNM